MQQTKIFNIAVIVAALGNFVDIYDLLIFSITRVASLSSFGLSEQEIHDYGVSILNWQMVGMLIGGIFWGILGDKKGRVSVLFVSILIYSIASILNAYITSIEQFKILRFISGFGLAGELGLGITLVNEIMTKERRGYGTMMVIGGGVCGALTASTLGYFLPWRTIYLIGGIMGLALLALRLSVYESGIFNEIRKKNVTRGNFLAFLKTKKSAIRFLCCILVGIPIWYQYAILLTFSNEFAIGSGVENFVYAKAFLIYTICNTISDFSMGYLSQLIKSRKKIIYVFLYSYIAIIIAYLFPLNNSLTIFYVMCGVLGFSCGYWTVYITTTSEQFGTNIRATVSSAVPNFVRGSVPIILLSHEFLKSHYGLINSALIVGIFFTIIALIATTKLEETYGKDLNYSEKL